MKYSLPDINLEKERVKKAIAKHGPPRGCLVEYAAQHGLNLGILRNWVEVVHG